TFAGAESTRAYGRVELELAEELGRRAALAADNAWLYRSSQEARRAAERANRAKDEFLATLSHELRTPLTPILGWTVMLRSGTLDPTSIHRGLEVIERNVRAQTQLIGDLLDVSRIITGKLRLEVSPIAVVPVVEAGVQAGHRPPPRRAARRQRAGGEPRPRPWVHVHRASSPHRAPGRHAAAQAGRRSRGSGRAARRRTRDGSGGRDGRARLPAHLAPPVRSGGDRVRHHRRRADRGGGGASGRAGERHRDAGRGWLL